MTAKQVKKETKKVFHSIVEFKKHFFPKFHEKELLEEKSQDPREFWDWFGRGVFGGGSARTSARITSIKYKRP